MGSVDKSTNSNKQYCYCLKDIIIGAYAKDGQNEYQPAVVSYNLQHAGYTPQEMNHQFG